MPEAHGLTSMSGERYRLRAGRYAAEVVQTGATLRVLTIDDRDLILPFGLDEVRPHMRGAVMVPWPGRIEDGRYTFDGEDHQLPLTEPASSTAIHGLMCWAPFTAGGAGRRPRSPGRAPAAAGRLPLRPALRDHLLPVRRRAGRRDRRHQRGRPAGSLRRREPSLSRSRKRAGRRLESDAGRRILPDLACAALPSRGPVRRRRVGRGLPGREADRQTSSSTTASPGSAPTSPAGPRRASPHRMGTAFCCAATEPLPGCRCSATTFRPMPPGPASRSSR